jgi:hypothetical protein
VGPPLAIVCNGVRPQVSKAARDGFLVEFADSIELRLEVRLWNIFDSALVDRCLGTPNDVGGNMEMAFGLLSGRMICEAPLR